MYNNAVQIYNNDLLTKKLIALKMLSIAWNCMGVV